MSFHRVISHDDASECLVCGTHFADDDALDAAPNCPGVDAGSRCEDDASHVLYLSGPGEVSCGLCGAHNLTTLRATDEDRVRAAIAEAGRTGEEVPESIVRVIAEWWQSPGRIGREMARFASTGTITDPETSREDYLATYAEAKRLPADERAFHTTALDCLGTHVLNVLILVGDR